MSKGIVGLNMAHHYLRMWLYWLCWLSGPHIWQTIHITTSKSQVQPYLDVNGTHKNGEPLASIEVKR